MATFFVVVNSILLASAITATVTASPLTDSIDAQERALATLAAQAESRYASRCRHLNTCASSCSVPACGDMFTSTTGFHCNSTFGNTCGASCPGMMRSLTHSAVRFPRTTSFSSADSQAFVCASKGLENDFTRNIQEGTVKAWQYIGDESGAARIYPGAPQERSTSTGCSNYDSRLRPWYIAASSGPKDIVIIIDQSGSMTAANDPLDSTAGSRMDAVKKAVSALLGTLTQNDFAAVVSFSNTAQVLRGQTTLQRMTATNVQALQSSVNAINADGGTYFNNAFTSAFNLLEASDRADASSSCTRLILFLTDGQATDPVDATYANIAARQSALGSRKAHIFTYSMSSGADHTAPRAIACANDGVWANIVNGADPLAAMSQYYQFLASSITSNQVRWTTPYTDAFGMGEMVTAAKPVFDRSNANLPIIVGVVGLDVTMAELRQHGDYSTVVSTLIARSSTCPTVRSSECQLQHLRDLAGSVCPGNNTIAACTANQEIVTVAKCSAVSGNLNSLLCQDLQESSGIPAFSSKSTSEVACCSGCSSRSSAGALVSLLSAAVAMLICFFL